MTKLPRWWPLRPGGLIAAPDRPVSQLLASPDTEPDGWPAPRAALSGQPSVLPHRAPPRRPVHAAPPPALDPAAIRRSLAGLEASPQKVAGDFYGYLFAACPRLRDMFPPQMNTQNERLFAALLKIVNLIDQPDVLARYLTQLGADHRKYGVRAEHYAPVGTALIQTLRRHCPAWDETAEAAWAAAYAVASDAMIAGAASASGPPFWRGRVVRHERRTADVAVLELRTDYPLPFEPGQFITVQTGKWRRVWRPFSIANAPDGDGTRIDLHVRQVSGGWVSTALVRDTGLDDEVLIGPAVGTMTAEELNGRDLMLLAGGTGLAPLKAIAEDVLARDEVAVAGGWGLRRNICMFHGVRSPVELYDMPALRELERCYPWFQALPVVQNGRFTGLQGPVTDAALGYGDWSDRDVFVAGPGAMVARAASGLHRAGLLREQVHHDELEAG